VFARGTTDIGRLVTDLPVAHRYAGLERMITESIDSLSVRAREVQTRDGQCIWLRIRAYRTTENKIDGRGDQVAGHRPAQAQSPGSRAARDLRCHGGDGSRTLIVLNDRLRVQAANRAFPVFHITKEETMESSSIPRWQTWNIAPCANCWKTFCEKLAAGGFEVIPVPRMGGGSCCRTRAAQRDGDEYPHMICCDGRRYGTQEAGKSVCWISVKATAAHRARLHDGLGQHLTGIGFISGRWKTALAAKHGPKRWRSGERSRGASKKPHAKRDLAKIGSR